MLEGREVEVEGLGWDLGEELVAVVAVVGQVEVRAERPNPAN